MPHVAVLGGSIVGSAIALQLARSGWRVTVVDPELDLLDVPEPAPRPGAPHTVHAHGFMSRTHHELATRLPDVLAGVVDRGAPVVELAAMVPPPLHDGGRPGDEQLRCLRSRRWLIDRVIAEAVRREAGITLVPERATGLLLEDDGRVPTVHGLALADGKVEADLTIDAGGRRSAVRRWLGATGLTQPERVDPCVVRYYTRHFRLRDGTAYPPLTGFAVVHDFPSLVQLIFLGDNGTAMMAQAVHDRDPSLTALRHPDAFDAVAAANPELTPWLEVLEPISPVFCLGAFDNRMRRLVDDGRPVVRGLQQVGDALAMTNPTRGRGMAMGLAAAGVLHDLLVSDGRDPDALALAFDAWQQRALAVYYRETAAVDTVLSARLTGGLEGRSVPGNAPGIELPEGHPVSPEQFERAAGRDPDLFRLQMRAVMLLDDERVVAAPETTERVRRVLAALPEPEPSPTPPSEGVLHDRAALDALLAPHL